MVDKRKLRRNGEWRRQSRKKAQNIWGTADIAKNKNMRSGQERGWTNTQGTVPRKYIFDVKWFRFCTVGRTIKGIWSRGMIKSRLRRVHLAVL